MHFTRECGSDMQLMLSEKEDRWKCQQKSAKQIRFTNQFL